MMKSLLDSLNSLNQQDERSSERSTTFAQNGVPNSCTLERRYEDPHRFPLRVPPLPFAALPFALPLPVALPALASAAAASASAPSMAAASLRKAAALLS